MKPNLGSYDFKADTKLAGLLGLEPPSFSRTDPFKQLGYVERYVRQLGCSAVLAEGHYIDRDYIEDYSLFYSRSFSNYPNHCRRLHFFRSSSKDTKELIRRAEDACTLSREDRDELWRTISSDYYLGFCVVKPLHGSPVGRTILRCFPEGTQDGTNERRVFPVRRRYPVHLGPIQFDVLGLPFQQQDVGVSACATTALWSALHRIREFEEIGSPTPAQITTLATQHSLPFGRAMPSDEGLSLDQMCQALHALGVAPSLLSATSFEVTRFYIYATLRSSFAPVLILQSTTDSSAWHAVTAVGYRESTTPQLQDDEVYDLSADMIALYVHDDRIGPYQRVNVIRGAGGTLQLVPAHVPDHTWHVRYVLIPLHQKIRVFVSGLFELVLDAVAQLRTLSAGVSTAVAQGITYDTWISRPQRYLQELLATGDKSSARVARTLVSKITMPRYIGVVRIAGANLGFVDLLVDTTSTMKNLHCIAVASHGVNQLDVAVVQSLAAHYRCPAVYA